MQLQQVIDSTPWIPSWHETGASIDRRHCLWIYEILKRTGVKRTLEIGSHNGCSSSAFIHANIPDAHFADVTVNHMMREVIGDKGTIHQRKGCDVIREEAPFDLIFLDGAHDLKSVQEEWEAMQDKLPRILILHDSWSKHAGFPHCEGPDWLCDNIPLEWDGENDMDAREGEMTHRGMTVLTREPKLREMVLEAMLEAGCS